MNSDYLHDDEETIFPGSPFNSLEPDPHDLEEEMWLSLDNKPNQRIYLKTGISVTIGRKQGQDVHIDDKIVSREHLVVTREHHQVALQIIGRNGIEMERQMIKNKEIKCTPPMSFKIGNIRCSIAHAANEYAPSTASPPSMPHGSYASPAPSAPPVHHTIPVPPTSPLPDPKQPPPIGKKAPIPNPISQWKDENHTNVPPPPYPLDPPDPLVGGDMPSEHAPWNDENSHPPHYGVDMESQTPSHGHTDFGPKMVGGNSRTKSSTKAIHSTGSQNTNKIKNYLLIGLMGMIVLGGAYAGFYFLSSFFFEEKSRPASEPTISSALPHDSNASDNPTEDRQPTKQELYYEKLLSIAKKRIEEKEYDIAKEYLLAIPDSSVYYDESKQLINSIILKQ